MQSTVMHDYEDSADVQLVANQSGIWTVPPYFIDRVTLSYSGGPEKLIGLNL